MFAIERQLFDQLDNRLIWYTDYLRFSSRWHAQTFMQETKHGSRLVRSCRSWRIIETDKPGKSVSHFVLDNQAS